MELHIMTHLCSLQLEVLSGWSVGLITKTWDGHLLSTQALWTWIAFANTQISNAFATGFVARKRLRLWGSFSHIVQFLVCSIATLLKNWLAPAQDQTPASSKLVFCLVSFLFLAVRWSYFLLPFLTPFLLFPSFGLEYFGGPFLWV